MKNRSTFQQCHLVDGLVKQVGLTDYDEIKKKLRIKKPVAEISKKTCSRLITELINHRDGGRKKFTTIESMKLRMKIIKKKLYDYDFNYQPWMDTDYDDDGNRIT